MTELGKQPIEQVTRIDLGPERFYHWHDFLRKLWIQETGQDEAINNAYAKRHSSSLGSHFPFWAHYPMLGLMLELGVSLKPMNESIYPYFESLSNLPWSALKEEKDIEEINKLPELKPFEGLRILCVGGAEGRVAVHLGATAINIDPAIHAVPSKFIDRGKLTEMATPFDQDSFAQLFQKDQFDIIMSLRLFSAGSTFAETPEEYKEMMQLMSQLIRPGGYMLHHGDLVEDTLSQLENKFNVYYLDQDTGWQAGNWVMQKQA